MGEIINSSKCKKSRQVNRDLKCSAIEGRRVEIYGSGGSDLASTAEKHMFSPYDLYSTDLDYCTWGKIVACSCNHMNELYVHIAPRISERRSHMQIRFQLFDKGHSHHLWRLAIRDM